MLILAPEGSCFPGVAPRRITRLRGTWRRRTRLTRPTVQWFFEIRRLTAARLAPANRGTTTPDRERVGLAPLGLQRDLNRRRVSGFHP